MNFFPRFTEISSNITSPPQVSDLLTRGRDYLMCIVCHGFDLTFFLKIIGLIRARIDLCLYFFHNLT